MLSRIQLLPPPDESACNKRTLVLFRNLSSVHARILRKEGPFFLREEHISLPSSSDLLRSGLQPCADQLCIRFRLPRAPEAHASALWLQIVFPNSVGLIVLRTEGFGVSF